MPHELEAEVRRWQLQPGDLLIVDEASLAGTFALDRLAAQARQAGAKLLLVGDPAQLGAVGAGGAFGMLVADRACPPELVEARRFTEAWERRASAELRAGSPQRCRRLHRPRPGLRGGQGRGAGRLLRGLEGRHRGGQVLAHGGPRQRHGEAS